MNFNKNTDNIAVTIPGFRLRKTAEGKLNIFNRKNEIHIATVAIDQNGQQDSKPAVYINKHSLEYAVKPWERVNFLGDGRLIYGPGNPGAFVYVMIVFVESDRDIRAFGKNLEDIVKTDDFSKTLSTIGTLINPSAQIITSIISPLTQLLSKALQKDSDNAILTQEGVFFRDKVPPYNVGDEFTYMNQHIEFSLRIIPLIKEIIPSPKTMTREGEALASLSLESENVLNLEKLGGEPVKIHIGFDDERNLNT